MRAAFAVLALCSVACPALPALAADGVPCSFYGIDPGPVVDRGETFLDAALADRLATAGAGAVRIGFRLDGRASWSPAKLAEYDAIVDAVRAAGLEPLGLLSNEAVPGEYGQDQWNDDPDGDGLNDYVGAFSDASATLLSHFEGSIRRWEIWDEPNCFTNPSYVVDPQNAGCTYILPRVYASLLAGVVVSNKPLFDQDRVSLTTGGLLAWDDGGAPSPGTDYLGDLYASPVWDELEASAGRRYAWDYLGVHLYIDQAVETDDAAIAGYLDPVRDLAAQYDDESRMSITGVGWTTGTVGEEVQAANLTTAMTYLAERDDIIDAYWYSYRDDPGQDFYFGIVTETGAPKLALGAMRDVAAGCEGGGGGGPTTSGGGTGTPGGQGPSPITGGSTVPAKYDGRRPSSCALGAPGREHDNGGSGREVGWIALLAAGLFMTRAANTRARASARRVT